MRKIIMAAVLFGVQMNTTYGMDFGDFDDWRRTRSLHQDPAVHLAVAPKDPADLLMMQIKFYYEQNDDDSVIHFCNEYLGLEQSKDKAQHYEKIAQVCFDLTPTAFPRQKNEFRLKSIQCFETYMRLEGFSPQTNHYNHIGMAYTELGMSITSNQEEYFTNAAKSFDKFFEKAGVFSAHNCKAAGAAYYNLSGYKKSLKNLSKSAKYWELFFQFASPDIIETQDYEKAAISLFSAAGQKSDLEKETSYYAQSKRFWDEYVSRNGRNNTPQNNRIRALTYYYNAIRTGLESDFKKSALYWNLFATQKDPTIRDIGNIISMNQKAASFETDPVKRARYLKKSQDLMEKHDIHSTYQIGDIVILVNKAEARHLATQPPMIIDLETYVDPESCIEEDLHEEKEVQVGATAQKLSKSQKKNRNKRLKEKSTKSIRVFEPSETSEAIINEEENKNSFLDETPTETRSSLAATATQENDNEEDNASGTSANPRLTKKEMKQLKSLEKTAARKELAALKGSSQEVTRHIVDPLTVMQIKKAYQDDPAAQAKALGILDKILDFKKGVGEREVLASLEQMKKYFSVSTHESSSETVILGHNISQFYFHGVHKSGGDASWKPGMVVRLREFANTIKQTFEAIMAN